MSRINELIKEKCPKGVRFYKLLEIGSQYNGLSGKSKKDFENGNYKYITYSNIYNNPSTRLDIDDYVNVIEGEKQNEIRFKDILITGSSENLEDSGMISVVTEVPKEKIFLNSFCFGFRLKEKFYDKYNADFLKHLFRDNNFRNEIISCSFGVTRYNLSKEKFLKIKIPCPPLEVQEEIARILDKFGELEAELKAELEAESETRKQQYEFWLDKMFNSSENLKTIKEILLSKGYIRGPFGSALVKSDMVQEGVPIYEQQHAIYNHRNFRYYITKEKAEKLKRFSVKFNDLIISCSGTVGKVSIIGLKDPIGIINQALLILRINEGLILSQYLKYYLESKRGKVSITTNTNKSAQINISSRESIERIKIPVPSLEKQQRIVNILDKFDKLVNAMSEGLLAEIELRKKQYKYYRNKLLSFEELGNE